MEDTKVTIKRSHWVLALISFLFIVSGIIFSISNRNRDKSEWVKNIGIVEYRTYGRSGTRMFAHQVDDHMIRKARGGKGLEGGTIGDIYEILYNPQDPQEISIFNDKPIFLKDEVVHETTGQITDDTKITVENGYKEAFPEFAYHVNNKRYTRVQKIRVADSIPLRLQKGMKFKVQYLPQNPQRSILYFKQSD